jgi:iron complex outermembrane receptor protein
LRRRPDDHWAFTVPARWQDLMWSTLTNNDIAHGVYGSFDRFFAVDTKIPCLSGSLANPTA